MPLPYPPTAATVIVSLVDGLLTRDAHAVVSSPDVDLVVEVIGGIEYDMRDYFGTVLFGVLAYVLMKGFSDTELTSVSGADATQQSTAAISDLIFKPYLLPFWALSFVLLAAVIGAIVLARKD